MLRFLGFFLVVLLVYRLLFVPLFGRVPLLGFWISAIAVSWAAQALSKRALERQRNRNAMRELGAVDSPYNRGKLGSLLVGNGRHRSAVPHLQAAIEGDPETIEWPYRLGCALLALGRAGEAVPLLERVVDHDVEYAYGGALMRLAEARSADGKHEAALAALDDFERNHGEGAESAYRRGVALKRLGRRDEARTAFARVGRIASEARGFQKREAGGWAFKAWLARLV